MVLKSGSNMKQALKLSDGSNLAYSFREGRAPGVLFLGGFMSDMTGTKASFLDEFCKQHGQAYLRFDYFGHGQSSGDFLDGTITRWKNDAIEIIDKLTTGPQIVVGSSMGGWIMLLLAKERPERIKALIGVAAAPDFVKTLVWDQLTAKQQEEVNTLGVSYIPVQYQEKPCPITKKFIEDGPKNNVFGSELNIECPVRLLHGMQDKEVPYSYSLNLIKCLTSKDARLNLLKEGDHRLNSEEYLQLMGKTIAEFF